MTRRPSTRANGVSRCGRVRPRPVMCSTTTPRASSASARSERWHRQGTPSAHMIATGPVARERAELAQPLLELGRLHVVGVAPERGIPPGCVLLGPLPRAPQPAERRQVDVADPGPRERACERRALELRVRARARDGADVGERHDRRGGEQLEELLDRARGVSDREHPRAAPSGRGTQLRRRADAHVRFLPPRGGARHLEGVRVRGPLTSTRLWRKCARDADSQADGRPQEVAAGTEVHALGCRSGVRGGVPHRAARIAGKRADAPSRRPSPPGPPRGSSPPATASSSPSSPESGSACRTCARRSRPPGSPTTRSGRPSAAWWTPGSSSRSRSRRSNRRAATRTRPSRRAANGFSRGRAARPSARRGASSRRAGAPSIRGSGASRGAASAGARAR